MNLEDFVEKRTEFSTEEWLDLLVQSIGFNPSRFDSRVKMLMLVRLVPFVESNFNLIELGPRETGKTYTFRNTSSRAFVVSGGKATPATLFYNKASRKLGVIDTTLDLRQPDPRYLHLFQVLPLELQDPAFLDRIHAYLPGWEMPKIRPENYSTGYGLLTDYMAEIFAELRRRNFQTHINAWVDMGNMTGRNQDAVKKTTAGLLKLLYPHQTPDSITREELVPLLGIAIEMRKRVTDQLAKILPAEFDGVEYG